MRDVCALPFKIKLSITVGSQSICIINALLSVVSVHRHYTSYHADVVLI